MPLGADGPCQDCGRQRRVVEAWQTERDAAAGAAMTNSRREAALIQAREIADCDRCDEDGYVGAIVCSHRDHASAETRAAARAEVMAALSKGGASS